VAKDLSRAAKEVTRKQKKNTGSYSNLRIILSSRGHKEFDINQTPFMYVTKLPRFSSMLYTVLPYFAITALFHEPNEQCVKSIL
jgi:hypothetical protein